jgi:hypothetical protein
LTSKFNRLKFFIMVRTQIQLPDTLYQEIRRVAKSQEWSIAEVVRRGAEMLVRSYPNFKAETQGAWLLPPPLSSKLLVSDPEVIRSLIREDLEGR